MSKDLSRRQFWRIHPVEAVRSALSGRGSEKDERPAPIRPPGAGPDERRFLSACERCQSCSDACPHDVIQHLGPEWGLAEGTPFLQPETDPCRWCPDWDCIEACPSDALVMEASGMPKAIARAELDLDSCLVTQGTLCDVCVYQCPSDIAAISLKGRIPHIDEDACTGCGLCAFHCAAEPSAIQIRELETTGK